MKETREKDYEYQDKYLQKVIGKMLVFLTHCHAKNKDFDLTIKKQTTY